MGVIVASVLRVVGDVGSIVPRGSRVALLGGRKGILSVAINLVDIPVVFPVIINRRTSGAGCGCDSGLLLRVERAGCQT